MEILQQPGIWVERGAKLSLSTALCQEQWDEADRIALTATDEQKQFSLLLAALHGKADAVARAISYGANARNRSAHLYSHATPLHHAAVSGSLKIVKLLVEAGADLTARDSIHHRIPLGWAEYAKHTAIAAYLRTVGAKE